MFNKLKKVINKKSTFILLTLFGVVIVTGGAFFITSINNKDAKETSTIKTDKQAITSRFPQIGDVKGCYWKADVIGKEGNDRVPGPSAYWMKGFIELDKEKINSFIENYNMKQVTENLKFDFYPENYDLKSSNWFYSDEFNNYIKPPSFFGKFYIDNTNQLLYFDVRK
jgi:hypothetical protein